MMRATNLVAISLLVARATAKGASEGASEGASSEAKAASSKRTPIVTADLIYGTGELFYDIYDAAYTALLHPHVEKHGSTVMQHLDTLVELGSSKIGKSKKEVYDKVDEHKGLALQLKADITAKLTMVHDKVNDQVGQLVDKFDKAVPKFAGIFPKSVFDLTIFGAYCAFVLYIILRVVRFALGIFCCVFCCGCCRGGKKAAPKAKAGAKAKAGVKNGKK